MEVATNENVTNASVRNATIIEMAGEIEISRKAQKSRLRLFTYAVRKVDNLEKIAGGWKKNRGRPKRSWKEYIAGNMRELEPGEKNATDREE